jgi:putative SOS response-associated peptidase YedK
MCGRFAIFSSINAIIKYYNILNCDLEFNSNYNVSPGQNILSIKSEKNSLNLCKMNWGIEGSNKKKKITNIRSETVLKNFHHLISQKRCIIPVNGFYEWKKRKPYYIKSKKNELLNLGGIFTEWDDGIGNTYYKTAILTTSAQDKLYEIHSRKPVILNDEDSEFWLNSTKYPNPKILFNKYSEANLAYYRVSAQVNRYWNNFPSLIEELSEIYETPDLL